MDLIKIQEKDGQQLVSARELHTFLEVGTRFDMWAERTLYDSFAENEDFSVAPIFGHNSNGGRQTKMDYALPLDTAKQIAMMAKSEKGKQARRYFIECEKKLIAVQAAPILPMDYETALEALLKEVKAKKIAEESQRLAELEAQKQKALVQELVPHASYACEVLDSSSSYTTTQMAKELNFRSADALNVKLAEMKVQFKSGDLWVLTAKYSDKGYQKRGQKTITSKSGEKWQIPIPKWTDRGREFLHGLFNSEYKKALKPVVE